MLSYFSRMAIANPTGWIIQAISNMIYIDFPKTLNAVIVPQTSAVDYLLNCFFFQDNDIDIIKTSHC